MYQVKNKKKTQLRGGSILKTSHMTGIATGHEMHEVLNKRALQLWQYE